MIRCQLTTSEGIVRSDNCHSSLLFDCQKVNKHSEMTFTWHKDVLTRLISKVIDVKSYDASSLLQSLMINLDIKLHKYNETEVFRFKDEND